MLLILVITVCAVSDDHVIAKNIGILETVTNDPAEREKALDRILQAGGISDKRLVDYYRKTLSKFSVKHIQCVIDEICTPRFFNQETFELLIPAVEKHSNFIREILESVYKVRDKWWDKEAILSRLRKIITKVYTKVDLKPSVDIPNDLLPQWADMCMCYAFIGGKEIEPICFKALSDKRVIVNLNHLANTTTAKPVCSRVCDFAIGALLILHQADVTSVARIYGFGRFTNKDFESQNNAMFDSMIGDIGRIRQQFFSDPGKQK
jgi:hypothetical protein